MYLAQVYGVYLTQGYQHVVLAHSELTSDH